MRKDFFKPTLQQQLIIYHRGSAFIKACPGAGKTRLMVERARFLFKDMPPGRGIAFLSFTQAAVFELDTRLRQQGILTSPIFPSFIGTFDSFVWQFLIAPFGLKNSDLRPRLIPDLHELRLKPFDGAQELPLSCFDPYTHKIIPAAAKRLNFRLSNKPAHLIKAYETSAEKIRTELRQKG